MVFFIIGSMTHLLLRPWQFVNYNVGVLFFVAWQKNQSFFVSCHLWQIHKKCLSRHGNFSYFLKLDAK